MIIWQSLGMAAVLAAAAILPRQLLAQPKVDSYPDRPMRLIVPFPPGGGTDLVTRTMLPAWSAAFG